MANASIFRDYVKELQAAVSLGNATEHTHRPALQTFLESAVDGIVATNEPKWTDQEVGVAVGRGVPIVPIRMGKDPYGFMAKYQAISGSGRAGAVAVEIFRYVLTNEDLRVFGNDVLVAALSKSGSFDSSNSLSGFLQAITHLSPDQETALVGAFNENDQVHGAGKVRGEIVNVLKRATGNDYELGNYRLTKLPKSGEGQ